MLQIAFDHHLLNIKEIKLYRKTGHKNSDGIIQYEQYSLTRIINEHYNYINKNILLQRNGEDYGKKMSIRVIIDRTPKCHMEVAWEGI